MLRTEEQARKCWCSFARIYASVSRNTTYREASGYNRVLGDTDGRKDADPNPPVARCIAGECMAWRWANSWFDDEIDRVMRECRGMTAQEAASTIVPRGFCGLAGKPE